MGRAARPAPGVRRTGRVGPAAGQGEQGLPGLWVVAEADRLLERFLGCVVLTTDAQQLTLSANARPAAAGVPAAT